MKRQAFLIIAVMFLVIAALACGGTSERTTSETTKKTTPTMQEPTAGAQAVEATNTPASGQGAKAGSTETPELPSPTGTSTPMPTNSPRPILPTDTSVPKPTDTPKPEIKLEVLNCTHFVDSIGTTYFIGELFNAGDIAAEDIQIALSLLDSEGMVLAAESYNSVELRVAQAQSKYPSLQVFGGPICSLIRFQSRMMKRMAAASDVPCRAATSWTTVSSWSSSRMYLICVLSIAITP